MLGGAIIWSLASASAVRADEETENLVKAAQNPIANLVSLPLQNNTDFNWGPDEKTRNILNVQPFGEKKAVRSHHYGKLGS